MASTVLLQRERLADKAMRTSFRCRSEHQEEVELDLRCTSLSVIAVQREPYPNSEPVLAVSACIVPIFQYKALTSLNQLILTVASLHYHPLHSDKNIWHKSSCRMFFCLEDFPSDSFSLEQRNRTLYHPVLPRKALNVYQLSINF